MSHQAPCVKRDEEQQRYVLEIDRQPLGYAQYQEAGEHRIFTHTEIDDSLSGQGMGSRLIRAALDDTRQQGKRIVPECEFVAAYVQKHDDWNDLIDQPS